MAEKCYAGNRISYVVTERRKRGSGRIEVFVYHENKTVRQMLRDNSGNTRPLLERFEDYLDSLIRAEYWLARVMQDYKAHFEDNLVDFTFITFK